MRTKIISLIVWSLFFAACNNSEREKKVAVTDVTWGKEIAPIIFTTCTPCHRPGESGTFNLLSYSDAVKKSKLIRFVTKSRYMPPWPADPLYTHFVGERVLSEQQISLISRWVENGC